MSRARGFTLVEMIIVIAVILVVASLALGLFSSTVDDALRGNTEALIQSLDLACERYKAETGAYPPDDRLYAHLGKDRIVSLDGVTVTKRPPLVAFRKDQYDPASSAAVDAWGRPVRYKAPGLKVATHVDLWSAGSNGVEGDVDDVVNWKG